MVSSSPIRLAATLAGNTFVTDVTLVVDCKNKLGEVPVWDIAEQALYWVLSRQRWRASIRWVRWRMTISFARHQFPPAIIRHAVWLYLRFTLSYRDVEDLLAERGLDVSYETVRRWVLKFGPVFARELRRRRPRPTSRWHLDEMAVMIAGRQFWLWRAVDDEGEVLDLLVQRRRDKAAAVKLMRKLLKKQGFAPEVVVTDKLRSYGAAMSEIGLSARHEQGLRQNIGLRIRISRHDAASARCSVSNRRDQRSASCLFTPPSKTLSTSSAISHPAARSASSERKPSGRGEPPPRPESELGLQIFARPNSVRVTRPAEAANQGKSSTKSHADPAKTAPDRRDITTVRNFVGPKRETARYAEAAILPLHRAIGTRRQAWPRDPSGWRSASSLRVCGGSSEVRHGRPCSTAAVGSSRRRRSARVRLR
jgi:transposase-like protein